jgi:hypothetical protein
MGDRKTVDRLLHENNSTFVITLAVNVSSAVPSVMKADVEVARSLAWL